jgi:hypothetical protein
MCIVITFASTHFHLSIKTEICQPGTAECRHSAVPGWHISVVVEILISLIWGQAEEASKPFSMHWRSKVMIDMDVAVGSGNGDATSV